MRNTNTFIEVETSNGIMLINFDNVDSISKAEDGTAVISFTAGVDDYMHTLETYEEVRRKIADMCGIWAINEAKYIDTVEGGK